MVDFCFFDWKPESETIRLMNETCASDTILCVHDYVPGKADWLAHNLPVEREDELITAGQLARNDVVTCRLDDHVGEVARRMAESPYGFALVLSNTGVLLGRLRSSALDVPPTCPSSNAWKAAPRRSDPTQKPSS